MHKVILNPFKRNIHKATKCKLGKTISMIEKYPSRFPTPKYLLFIKEMIEDGWTVKIYLAKVSKYIFIEKGSAIYKIRFSNHPPILEKELENDCDYYVGISNTRVHTTQEIINIVKYNYDKLHPKN